MIVRSSTTNFDVCIVKNPLESYLIRIFPIFLPRIFIDAIKLQLHQLPINYSRHKTEMLHETVRMTLTLYKFHFYKTQILQELHDGYCNRI